MAYDRVSRSPVATTSKASPSTLTALPSPRRYRAIPSIQLSPSMSDVSMRVLCLMTQTLRPSSPRVSMVSVSMESPNV